jgi:Ca2+-binding RTX toxin-like protein
VRTLGGNDTVVGGTGELTVSGGAGGGIVYGSTAGGNQLTAGAQQTMILSLGTGDLITGTGNGDVLYGSNLGNDTVVGGAGMEILVGGTAAGATNTFEAGSGSPLIAPEASNAVVQFGSSMTTALAGTGSDVFQVTAGQAGGFDIVYNFNPALDMLQLDGFGSEQGAAQTAIADQYDAGGDSWVKLPDGTVLSFVGLSHLAASNVGYG